MEVGASVLVYAAEPFATHPFVLLKEIAAEVFGAMLLCHREKQ